jgi:hypothetical protein
LNPAGTTELLRRKFERDTVLTAPDRCPDHEWCDPAPTKGTDREGSFVPDQDGQCKGW